MPFSHRSLLTIQKNVMPPSSGSESEPSKQTIKNQIGSRLPSGSPLALCVVACLPYMPTAEAMYFSATSVKFQQTTH
jgi:hypothetical protein